jgi:hypothetical protein
MAERPWMFAENFITNGVGDNYTLALVVAKFHLAALHANNDDPEILAREAIFQLLYDTLSGDAVIKKKTIGDRITDSRSLKQIFADIVTIDLPLWQNMIKIVHPAISDQYVGMFPNGNEDINGGRIDNKILAVEALATATLADGALPAVTLLLDAMVLTLNTARNKQLGKKTIIKGIPGYQKIAIAAMCDAHFIDHGIVISKYSKNPGKIASFTDTESIKNHPHSDTYTITVNKGKVKTGLIHKNTVDTTYKVTSTEDAEVWVIDSAKNIIKPTGIFIPKEVETLAKFPALGNVANRVFQIRNLNPLVQASVVVVVTG